MSLLNTLILIIIFNHLLWLLSEARFRFLPEDPNAFSNCPEYSNILDINDFIDMSNFDILLEDDGLHLSGDVKFLWDAEPDDRIEFKSTILKYDRNGWQPTFVSHFEPDFCKSLFTTGHLLYTVWGKHIQEQGICLTKDVIYHNNPFVAKFEFNGPFRMTGPHKLQVILTAYNKLDQKKATVCIESIGTAEVF